MFRSPDAQKPRCPILFWKKNFFLFFFSKKKISAPTSWVKNSDNHDDIITTEISIVFIENDIKWPNFYIILFRGTIDLFFFWKIFFFFHAWEKNLEFFFWKFFRFFTIPDPSISLKNWNFFHNKNYSKQKIICTRLYKVPRIFFCQEFPNLKIF